MNSFITWLFRSTVLLGIVAAALPAAGQCPPTQLNNHNGGGSVPCLCFLQNEQAGAVFNAPAQDYPIEILKIGVGWGSQFGGNPPSQELGLHIYPAGLPNPGAPQFTLAGPVLNDGITNVFDISQVAGNKNLAGGPFTVTLEFLNQSSGNPFASSVVDDGNGCTPGRNVVFVIPGGWNDACPLGITGDWVWFVEYKCVGTVPTDDRNWGRVKVLYSSPRP